MVALPNEVDGSLLADAPKIVLMEGQKEFIHVPNADKVTMDIAIYQGGVGSGKTFVGSLLGLLLLGLNPGVNLLCLAKTFPLLRDTTMQTYFEIMELMGFKKDVHYTFNKAESLLTFMCYDNATIMFRHLQDPEKIKSINAGIVQIEEISQIGENDFRMALSRLRQAGIKRYRLFGHTNPEPAKGWIYKNFVKNNPGLVETEWENAEGELETAVLQYRRVIASTMDNKHLPPHYVQALKESYDEDYFNVYVLGQDADYRRGLAVPRFSEANIDDTIVWNKKRKLFLSCDFNVDPMCWVVGHVMPPTGDDDLPEFLIFDEIAMENTLIEEAAMEFASRYQSHEGMLVVGGDASGKNRRSEGSRDIGQTSYAQLMTYLGREGFTRKSLDVMGANPRVRDRIDVFNGAVCNAEGRRRIRIHPRCERLLYNMDNLKFVPGSSQLDLPTPTDIMADPDKKFLGHPFDAVSYLVYRYTPKAVEKGEYYEKHRRLKTYRT